MPRGTMANALHNLIFYFILFHFIISFHFLILFYFNLYRTFIFLLLDERRTNSLTDQRVHSLDAESTLILPKALSDTARLWLENEAT